MEIRILKIMLSNTWLIYHWICFKSLLLLLGVDQKRTNHNRAPSDKPTNFYFFLFFRRSFVLLFSIVLRKLCLLHPARAVFEGLATLVLANEKDWGEDETYSPTVSHLYVDICPLSLGNKQHGLLKCINSNLCWFWIRLVHHRTSAGSRANSFPSLSFVSHLMRNWSSEGGISVFPKTDNLYLQFESFLEFLRPERVQKRIDKRVDAK